MDLINRQLQYLGLWIIDNVQTFWSEHIVWIVLIILMFYFKRLRQLALVLIFLAILGLYNPILFGTVFIFCIAMLYNQFYHEVYLTDDDDDYEDLDDDEEEGDDDDEIW